MQHHSSNPKRRIFISGLESGGNSFGFMTANAISFGSDLICKCQQTFANSSQ
jgi:hypothetical protein